MPPPPPDALSIAQLLALPAEERTARLQRAGAENPALRERFEIVRRSLDEAGREPPPGGTALSPLAAIELLASALIAADPERAGDRVGPYRLLQKFGVRGCGDVWLAEQLEPVRRRVAVKILKAGMNNAEGAARFDLERQGLALMDHPNIVRLLDTGAVSDGRPFFALELVRDLPLTRHCDEHRLPLRTRVELFIPVCHAVQHAHEKGIVHRNLQPAGILVAMHDGVAAPRLIDFGQASVTGASLMDRAFPSRQEIPGERSAYTSPEQGGLDSHETDTRCDIFSLGVLLHELLVGQLPDGTTRPTQAWRALAAKDQVTAAKRRSTRPGKLGRGLRGDLDSIVQRCLEADPARRYETAAALALDLRRHLAHEAVRAHPPGRAYRFGKFLLRHPLAATIAALAGSALLAAAVFVFLS